MVMEARSRMTACKHFGEQSSVQLDLFYYSFNSLPFVPLQKLDHKIISEILREYITGLYLLRKYGK